MEEDFKELTKEEWRKDDLRALTCQIKEQESILRLKRRWLMDLPLTKTKEKRVKELLLFNDKIIPESLLRGDDKKIPQRKEARKLMAKTNSTDLKGGHAL